MTGAAGAPAQPSLRHWIASGVAAGLCCILLAAVVDRPLALWLHAHRDAWPVTMIAALSDVGLGLWWYGIALLGCLGSAAAMFLTPYADRRGQWRARLRSFLYILAALVATTATNWALKLAFGRTRPRALLRGEASGFFPFELGIPAAGFPSGHGQTVTTALVALWFVFPRHAWAFATHAVLVALSRVAGGAHYLADVVAGVWLGALVAVAMRIAFERRGGPVDLLPPLHKGRR